jgi:alpha-glucosidase (family GH31 glycosyl hydrolase)
MAAADASVVAMPPLYVREGAILALQSAAWDVQHSDQLGGVLEVQVYAGSDGSFDQVGG